MTLPDQPDLRTMHQLTRDELLQLFEEQLEGGIKINFSGKANARKIARKVRPRVARAVAKYGAGTPQDQATNLVIEGDNLQAMATLYKERGQVDLIITDPPYNTGKDFRYNDKWDEDPNDPGIGDLIGEDDGARHTKWMKFMWPRLQMMKSMLKPGGILAICIDHRELFRLGQMLDESELFGARNRIGIINWQKSYSPRNDNNHVSTATEYVLIYAKDIEKAKTGLLPRTASHNSRYQNLDRDPEGPWREHTLSAPTFSAKNYYAIQSPFTGSVYYPPGTSSWRHPKRNIRTWLEEWGCEYEEREIGDGNGKALMVIGGTVDSVPTTVAESASSVLQESTWPFIWFGLTGLGGPRVKRYLEKVKKGIVPMTYWADEDYDTPFEIGCTSWDHEESGRSQTGVKELNAIVGIGHGFETVKPLQLFQKIIQLWCPPNGLVLDPFAGSGTTGHAVLASNGDTQSNRSFILIEQGRPERGDSYARTLLAERLRRVVQGDWVNGQGIPIYGGFKFLALGKRVDAEALLMMEREELVDTVISSHFDISRRRGPGLINFPLSEHRYLVAKNSDNEGFFLVWDGPDGNTNFTEDAYIECAKEAKKAGLKPVYHVYARLNLYQTDNVLFYQIPDRILNDFGLDMRSEPFMEAGQ
jgi:adenine-specific DNA-methyltransferase